MHCFPPDEPASQPPVQERYEVHGKTYPAYFKHYSMSSDGRAILAGKVSIVCRVPRFTALNLSIPAYHTHTSRRRALDATLNLRELTKIERLMQTSSINSLS